MLPLATREEWENTENARGRQENLKQEAMHKRLSLQGPKAERLAEYVGTLQKVARDIELGRKWQRWYNEVYVEQIWEEWKTGMDMPFIEGFVDGLRASDDGEWRVEV
jgi:hypothetical protein